MTYVRTYVYTIHMYVHNYVYVRTWITEIKQQMFPVLYSGSGRGIGGGGNACNVMLEAKTLC